MIVREDLIKIGRFNKPHGIKGELSFSFTDDSFDENDECSFLICELNSIFVPFRIEEYRFKSDSTALMKLKGLENEEQAKILSNIDVYFPKEHSKSPSESDNYTWDYFIGFTLQDADAKTIGQILDVDDSTMNVLFLVRYKGNEILIPASEEIVLDMDHTTRIIQLELPEGILDL